MLTERETGLDAGYLALLEENAALHAKLALAEKRIFELEAAPRRAEILRKGLEYYALMGSNPAKDALRAAAEVRG